MRSAAFSVHAHTCTISPTRVPTCFAWKSTAVSHTPRTNWLIYRRTQMISSQALLHFRAMVVLGATPCAKTVTEAMEGRSHAPSRPTGTFRRLRPKSCSLASKWFSLAIALSYSTSLLIRSVPSATQCRCTWVLLNAISYSLIRAVWVIHIDDVLLSCVRRINAILWYSIKVMVAVSTFVCCNLDVGAKEQ